MDKDLIYNLKEIRSEIRSQQFYDECFEQLKKPEYSKVFMSLVNLILEPKKRSYNKVTPEDQLNKLKQVVRGLLDKEKITKFQYNNFIRDIDDDTQFLYLYDNSGLWSPLNKLNTNYYANARLFSRVLQYSKTYDSDRVLNELKNGSTDGLKYIINELENDQKSKDYIYSKFIINDPELINIIQTTSETGENVEEYIMTELKNNGWKIYHYGGNGDLIDQRFGIDIIIRKGKEIRTVQVKTVTKIDKICDNSYKVTGKFTQPYSNIDIFAFSTISSEIIITENEISPSDKPYEFLIKNPIIINLNQDNDIY